MRLVRNTDTPEGREFWALAKAAAEVVRQRPERANVGIDFEQSGVTAQSSSKAGGT